MAEYIEIELTEHNNPACECQFILSYGDLRHVGYVQKRTGFVQLLRPVPADVRAEIKQQVESKLGKSDLPVSEPPPGETEDDEDDYIP